MDCKYKLGEAWIPEKEFRQWYNMAKSNLEKAAQTVVVPEALDETTVIDRLLKNFTLQKTSNKEVFRVPRGRFASDGIEQQTLDKIERINDTYRATYGIESDMVVVYPKGEGFNARINKKALQEVENRRQMYESMKTVTPEDIHMEMLYYGVTRVDDEGSADPEIQHAASNKYSNYIDNKGEFLKILKNQLAAVKAKKQSIADKTTQEYDEILNLEKELELRIYGNKLPKDDINHVLGLQNELEELKKNITPASIMTTLANDTARLAQILDKAEPNFHELAEAEYIMQFFNSFTNTMNDVVAEGIQHGVISKEDLGLNDTEVVKLFNLLSKYGNQVKNLYYDRLNQVMRHRVEMVLQNDPALRRMLSSEDMKYEQLFETTDSDLTWWDANMMDGVTGTFTNPGVTMQMMKKILEEANAKHMSYHVKWNERLNAVQPRAESALRKLEKRLKKDGKLNTKISLVTKVAGVSYDFFRAKNKNGTNRNELVHRFSGDYRDQERIVRDRYYYDVNNSHDFLDQREGYAKRLAAYKKRNNWRERNSVMVDPRRLSAITQDPEFAEFSSYFEDDGGKHEQELKRHLGSEIGFNEYVEQQKQLIREYKVARKRFIKDLMVRNGVTSESDLDATNQMLINKWTVENEPFNSAKVFRKNALAKSGGDVVFPPMDKYNIFIPRRFKLAKENTNFHIDENGEKEFHETTEQTGYYDENFAEIEKDPDLKEFYELASEILGHCSFILSPEKQKQMMNKTLSGMEKSILETLLDPNVAFLERVSASFKKITDKIKEGLTIKKEQEITNAIMNPLTDELVDEVNDFVKTNGGKIKSRFNVAGLKFLQTLDPKIRKRYEIKGKRKPGVSARNPYNFSEKTMITYSDLSVDSKEMLGELLDIKYTTDKELMAAIGVTELTDSVPIGRIIHRAITAQSIKDDTFNLPKMLRYYSKEALMYAASTEAKPIIELIKRRHDAIRQYQGKKKVLESGKEAKPKLDKLRAQRISDRWFDKHVLKYAHPSLMGRLDTMKEVIKKNQDRKPNWVRDVMFGSLTSEQRELVKSIDDLIEREMSLPEESRNKELIEHYEDLKKNIGRTYSVRAFVDRLLDVVRFVYLGVSPVGAVFNLMAGKISNFVNAGQPWSYSEESYWRAEHIIMHSHANLITFGLPRRVGKIAHSEYMMSALKLSTMMKRFEVFQDATDEVFKASLNSSVKIPSEINAYYLQRKTEYVNQGTVLAAMLMDAKVQSKPNENGVVTTSSVWDAMKADGTLKEEYRTAENIAKWENASDENAADFKRKVDNVIKNNHGDYTTLGANPLSESTAYRIMSMFLRWMPRYVHTRFASDHYDISLGRIFKGRFRSHNAASGAAMATALGAVMFGASPVVLGFALGGAIAGKFAQEHSKSGNNSNLAMPVEYASLLIQSLANGILVPIKVVAGVSGLSQIKPIGKGLTAAGRVLESGHRDNEIDDANMRANVREMSIILATTMTRLLAYALMQDKDEDDEERGLLTALINMCGRLIQETKSFYDPISAYQNFMQRPAVVSYILNLIKFVESVDAWQKGENVYVAGKYAGESKLKRAAKNIFLPSFFRNEYGVGHYTERIMHEYGFDDLFMDHEDKLDLMLSIARAEYKEKMLDELTDEMKIKKDKLDKQIENALPGLRMRFPDLTDKELRNKAKRLQREELEDAYLKNMDQRVPTITTLKKWDMYKNMSDKEIADTIKKGLKESRKQYRRAGSIEEMNMVPFFPGSKAEKQKQDEERESQ